MVWVVREVLVVVIVVYSVVCVVAPFIRTHGTTCMGIGAIVVFVVCVCVITLWVWAW